MSTPNVDEMATCPNCGGGALVEGRLLGQLNLGGGMVFRPKGRGLIGSLLRRDLSVPTPVFACADCGLMWSFIKTWPLRRMMPPGSSIPAPHAALSSAMGGGSAPVGAAAS